MLLEGLHIRIHLILETMGFYIRKQTSFLATHSLLSSNITLSTSLEITKQQWLQHPRDKRNWATEQTAHSIDANPSCLTAPSVSGRKWIILSVELHWGDYLYAQPLEEEWTEQAWFSFQTTLRHRGRFAFFVFCFVCLSVCFPLNYLWQASFKRYRYWTKWRGFHQGELSLDPGSHISWCLRELREEAQAFKVSFLTSKPLTTEKIT